METTVTVGKSVIRIDSMDKACGRVKFNSDVIIPGILYCKMVTSKFAHAKIKAIDISRASKASGGTRNYNRE